MKYSVCLLFLVLAGPLSAQRSLPLTFFEGKSVVLLSSDPAASPTMIWEALADSVHTYLVAAGADPVAYYELEQVVLSAERQEEYAKAFLQRQVKNIIFVTRQKERTSIHVGAFSGDGKLIASHKIFGGSAGDWKAVAQQVAALGRTEVSKNLLVNEVAEFPLLGTQAVSASRQKFLAKNPLNLEVFVLGIPLEGTSARTGATSSFRFDLFGKSEERVLSEQKEQKSQLEEIFTRSYPHEIAWLAAAKSDQQLLADRIQFVLVKVEGRQGDLMESLGLPPATGEAANQLVVKYCIRFLVREELYLGPVWDAHPDWRIALQQFLDNLKK